MPTGPAGGAGGIPRAVRRMAFSRSLGNCEACGLLLPARGAHMHHRIRRGQTVLHTLPNLIVVHPLCHVEDTASIHRNPEWARTRGLLLRGHQNPDTEPIQLADGTWVLLDPNLPIYRVVA